MRIHRVPQYRAALLFSALTIAGLAALPASPQTPAAPATTLSVDARLVNLPVVVRDKKGALVQNLTRSDFVLQVDEHAQAIRYFDLDTDLPLTLGLLVDTSLSQRGSIDEERSASAAFLEHMLTPVRDKAFVIQFARSVELLQDLTDSRPKLQAALQQLDSTSTPDPAADPDSTGDGQRARHGGGTALYDAIFLASDEVMGKQHPGRRALILLTDGVDSGSKETLGTAIEAAQRADTIVYAIYFKGEQVHDRRDSDSRGHAGGGFPGGRSGGGYPGGHGGGYPGGYPGGGSPGGGGGRGNQVPAEVRPDGRKILARITEETGGRLFETTRKDTTAQIYSEIGDELRAQYRLGFTPDPATAAPGYHHVDLALPARKKLVIQTREGYYAGHDIGRQ